MAHPDLIKYIEYARTQKMTDGDIKTHLMKSGWAEAQVDEALSNTKPSSLQIPAPPVPHFGMWVTFQYVILFISLYVSSTSLGGILNYAVNQWIPDKLDKTVYPGSITFQTYLLRGYLAGLIVSFPIFLVLFIILKRQSLVLPTTRSLRARKQLIYITLVITFIILIAHLISTIYNFLGGEVTARALAHFGVTLLVAGSIFVYFLLEVKEDRKTS